MSNFWSKTANGDPKAYSATREMAVRGEHPVIAGPFVWWPNGTYTVREGWGITDSSNSEWPCTYRCFDTTKSKEQALVIARKKSKQG